MSKWIKNDSGSEKTWVSQTIANGSYYQISASDEPRWSSDSTLLTAIGNGDAVVAKDDSGSKDIADVNEAIDYLKGALPADVRTRSERSDISLKLCCNTGTCDSNGDVTIEFKVPGTYGTDPGREIAGGIAFWNTPAAGDRITDIDVVDKDNVIGLGAGTVIKSWHDSSVTSYQNSGLYTPLLAPMELASMGDWGLLPSGLYLRLKAKGTATTGKLYVNVVWGEPS